MSIYWEQRSVLNRMVRRWGQPAAIVVGASLVLYWSPLWLVPTRLGLMLTLLLYMGFAYGALWWAVRRLDFGPSRYPFFLLLVVSIYLTLVAVSLVPIMQALSSNDVECERSVNANTERHTCTGHLSTSDLDWSFSGETIAGLPLMWMTDRDFEPTSASR